MSCTVQVFTWLHPSLFRGKKHIFERITALAKIRACPEPSVRLPVIVDVPKCLSGKQMLFSTQRA